MAYYLVNGDVSPVIGAIGDLQPFTGAGLPAGTPVFMALDGSSGQVAYVTAAQFSALLAGSPLLLPPGVPTIAVNGTPTYNAITVAVTAPTTGGPAATYGVYYRPSGGTAAFVSGNTPSASLSQTCAVPASASTPVAYDLQVFAANAGSTGQGSGSNIITVTVPVQTETVTIAATPSGTLYVGNPVTLTGSVNIGTVYVSVSTGGSEQTPRTQGTVNGSTWTATVTPATAGTYTASAYAAVNGGVPLATTGSFGVVAAPVETATISSPTGSAYVGAPMTVTGTVTSGATIWVGIYLKGTLQGSRTTASVTTGSGAQPWTVTITPASAGSYSFDAAATSGGTALVSGGAVTVSAASSSIGPNLTLTSPTFDTTAAKFGQALSGGSGMAPVTASAGPRTYECWFKSSTSTFCNVILDNDPTGANGIQSYNGHALLVNKNVSSDSGLNVCDGAWHHLAAVFTGNYSHLYVDGVATSAALSGSPAANPTINVAVASGLELDEVAVFNYAKYTSNFIPPTTPYTSTATGLVAAWHLDGSGASA